MKSARFIKNQKGLALSKSKGFTLIELLVVIGILAILLSIVLIAINPARQFGQANDTKRKSDTTAILNAIGAYAADNHGTLPAGIPVAPTPAVDVSTIQTLCHDLLGSGDAKNPTGASYISALPADPQNSQNGAPITTCPAASDTPAPVASDYLVQQDSAGRVTVYANLTQIDVPTISVQR